VLVFVCGWLQALAVALGNIDRIVPYSAYYYGDAQVFLDYAEAVAEGNLYDNGIPFHPPFAAWCLAGMGLGLGQSLTIVTMKSALAVLAGVIGAAACALAWMLSGPASGLAAGLIVSFSFGISVLATVPGTEALYLALTLPTLILALKPGARRPRAAVIAGALTGVACLTRAEHVLLIPLFLLALLRREQDRRGNWAAGWVSKNNVLRAALFLAAAAVPLAPWTARNAALLAQMNRDDAAAAATSGAAPLEPVPVAVPVTIYGPLNFALANMPPATGEFTREALPLLDGSEHLNLRHPDHRQFVVHGYRLGWEALRADPGRAVRLLLTKLNIAWDAFALGFTAANAPAGLTGFRRPVDLFTPSSRWFRWVLPPLALVGWAALWRRNRTAAIVLATIVVHRLVVTVAFFGYVRQGMLLFPLAAVLAAFPLVRVQLDHKRIKAALIIAASAALLATAYNVWSARELRRFDIRYATIPGTDVIDHQARMELTPK